MKLRYTEHRTTVNRDTVEVSEEFTDKAGFLAAVLKEVGTCMDFEAHDVAQKLIDWHQKINDQDMLKPGVKLVHNYGGGLDPVGTWEIIA